MTEDGKPLTMDDLRARVSNYQNFAVKESSSAPKDVFTSAVFSREVIQKLLEATPETNGIRIYMAKGSQEDNQEDVSYVLMPVAESNGTFTDQIDDTHEFVRTGLVTTTACIGKFCGQSGSFLITA